MSNTLFHLLELHLLIFISLTSHLQKLPLPKVVLRRILRVAVDLGRISGSVFYDERLFVLPHQHCRNKTNTQYQKKQRQSQESPHGPKYYTHTAKNNCQHRADARKCQCPVYTI